MLGVPEFENGRQLLQALRDRLDEWIRDARAQAYEELFEGEDAILTAEELRELDRIDSQLSREGGGLWGAEEFAIIPSGTLEEESTPHVVCTYYPQIPEYATRDQAPVDNETRERLNDALWEYTEQVVELAQEDLESFVWSSDVKTWLE